ncbi:MAG: hypothetical protein LBO09_09080 [Candidatus Peribacteria bacterium]|jgi:hypothetical protein|nr:hypothetical protein [Candidatus Peribacteria bacterium]
MANYEVENNFDKNLGSFLETFIIQEKQSLINNLSGTKEDVAEFDEDLQKFKQREIGFYNLVLSKLHEYVGENTENIPIYLFFDIDETIAKLDFN